jgi:hypothetical protein
VSDRDFFNDDEDFSLDDADFPDDVFADDDDDLVFEQDSGGGISRTFVLLAGFLAVIFVIVSAVIAVIILGGDDGPSDTEILATTIKETNDEIMRLQAASQTQVILQSTDAAGTEIAQNATSTSDAQQAATSTESAQQTSAAATSTAESVNATATQQEEFRQRTATADAATDTPSPTVAATDDSTPTPSPTPAPDDVTGQLRDPNTGDPGIGFTICVYRDDGDGVFEPGETTSPDCAPSVVTGAGGGSGGDTGGSSQPLNATATRDALFGTATAQSGTPAAPAGTPTTGAAATSANTNPIFQTATARAAGNTGGGIIATPTEEGGATGARFDPMVFGPVGRQAAPSPTAEGGEAIPPGEASPSPAFVEITQTPTSEAIGGAAATVVVSSGDDEYVAEVVTDAQGRFIIRGLPVGSYFITIGGQLVSFNVRPEPQVLTIPFEGTTIELLVAGVGQGISTPTPEGGALTDFQRTATAIALGTAQGGAVPTELPDTGFFDGDDDVSGSDLTILAVIGAFLIGLVFAARRMRGSSAT